MEKTFKFNSRFGEYEIKFVRSKYMFDDTLAVLVLDKDPDLDWWEEYGTLTVNLGHSLEEGTAYLDTNNLPDLAEFVINKGWAEVIDMGHSGFCTYPLAAFTSEFLEEICEEA